MAALQDRDGLPVYVDCAGERLEKFYGHLGFEKIKGIELVDPCKENNAGTLPMCTMVRKPQAAA